MDFNDLAVAGRTMSFNDLQSGAPIGEGQADDRNVELLVADRRSAKGGPTTATSSCWSPTRARERRIA